MYQSIKMNKNLIKDGSTSQSVQIDI